MIDFSRWKLGLLGLVLLAGVLYALPNLFPQDLAVQGLHRHPVLDEVGREIVEQLGVGGLLAVDAEVARRVHEAGADVFLPHAVDDFEPNGRVG